jgi:hypothetical protein
MMASIPSTEERYAADNSRKIYVREVDGERRLTIERKVLEGRGRRCRDGLVRVGEEANQVRNADQSDHFAKEFCREGGSEIIPIGKTALMGRFHGGRVAIADEVRLTKRKV